MIPITDELPADVLVAGLVVFVAFAIAVMLLPPPSSTQHEAISTTASGRYDSGVDFLRRLAPVGISPQVTMAPDGLGGIRAFLGTATMTGRRWSSLLSPSKVLPILSLATDGTERQLSVRGLMDAVSARGLGRGIFGLPAMFRWEASRTLTNVDLWSRNNGAAWGLPYDWHLTTFQETIPRSLKRMIMGCPGTSCPDLTAAIGQKTQKESSEEEESPSSAHAASMEITYDPSPPSVASPALALFCDSRLPLTPTPFLVACDAVNAGMAGSWGVSFQYSTWEGAVDSDQWHVSVDIGSGFQIMVASALPDLLDEFGVNQIRGSSLQTRQGLQLTSASQQVLKEAITPTGQFFAGITSKGSGSGYFAGITSQGLAAGFEITSGQFGAQVTAIAGSQIQLAGALIFQAGDLGLGYTWGPDGNALVGRFTRQPFDLAIALIGSDIQVGLSYTPEGGPTVQASWSGTNGFAIAITASFKISFDTVGHGLTLEPFQPSVELPLGRGNLVITPPAPLNGPSPPSVDFTWSPPAPPQPATP